MVNFDMNLLAAAIGLATSSGIWLYFILQKDKIEREPLTTFVLVGLGGGVISVIFAVFLGTFFSAATGLRFLSRPMSIPDAAILSLFVGFNEEFFKCAAAMALIGKLREFDEPADGVIYAMAVSLGFATIENIGYMAQSGPAVLISRTFLSVPGHLGFGALWGTGLAAARFRLPKGNMLRTVLPYLVVAALCHALYDFWLFAHLPMSGLVVPLIVLLLWSYASRKMKFLVAHSPFLPLGRCPECGVHNRATEGVCPACGAIMYRERSL